MGDYAGPPKAHDVAKIWGVRGQLCVKGEINGSAFRTSIFPDGNGNHYLLVNKRMQAGAKAGVGSRAKFRMEPDTEERVIETPPELIQAISEDRALRRWFDQLSPGLRKEIAAFVADVKSEAARQRRADQMAERLLATKEAERELPPVIRAAFASNAKAAEGWKRMSPAHRRRHLFAVFYYRSPEAQARRIARMLQEAAGKTGDRRTVSL